MQLACTGPIPHPLHTHTLTTVLSAEHLFFHTQQAHLTLPNIAVEDWWLS